jgi:hypothetical protein
MHANDACTLCMPAHACTAGNSLEGYFCEKNIHDSIEKYGYMFCRPSHNFGAKLEKLQISVLIMSAILDS